MGDGQTIRCNSTSASPGAADREHRSDPELDELREQLQRHGRRIEALGNPGPWLVLPLELSAFTLDFGGCLLGLALLPVVLLLWAIIALPARAIYRALLGARYRLRIARPGPDRRTAVLRMLERDQGGEADAPVLTLIRRLQLPTEVVAACSPVARGDKATPAD